MADPQIEDGYFRIANELADAFAKVGSYEARIIWFVLRKTYGYGKKMDRISLSRFSDATGIVLHHVPRTIKTLIKKKILLRHAETPQHIYYGIQKDYESWNEPLPNPVVPNPVVPNLDQTTTILGNEPRPDLVDTKDILKTITKDSSASNKSTLTSSPIAKQRKLTRPDPAALAGFDAFYLAYPRRVDKPAALKAWTRLAPSPELIREIMSGLSRYCESVKDTDPKYIKHPGPWLNTRRWEDEPISNGHDKPKEVKDLGNGFVEVDGKPIERRIYERRFANAAK